MATHGWMRPNRRTLSVYRWFKPLSHDCAAIESREEKKKKIPSVFVSHRGRCYLPLTVNLSVTVRISPSSPLTPPPFITIPQYIHPSIHSPNGLQMFVSSLSPSTSLHPPPLWSPQKRLIQEGWAGVSELLLLCPMQCFHSTFLLLCCFYGPDMLTVQVAQSQSCQPNKGCLFGSFKRMCAVFKVAFD